MCWCNTLIFNNFSGNTNLGVRETTCVISGHSIRFESHYFNKRWTDYKTVSLNHVQIKNIYITWHVKLNNDYNLILSSNIYVLFFKKCLIKQRDLAWVSYYLNIFSIICFWKYYLCCNVEKSAVHHCIRKTIAVYCA